MCGLEFTGLLVFGVFGDKIGESGRENGLIKGFFGDFDNGDIKVDGFVMGDLRDFFLFLGVLIFFEGRGIGFRDSVKDRFTGDFGVGEGDFFL